MASENDTIADIIAEMRKRKDMLANAAHSSPLCYAVDTLSAQAELLDEFIDRLDAAAKRDAAIHVMTCEANERLREHLEIALENDKRTPVGNAAAIREALMSIKHLFRDINLCEDTIGNEAFAIADAALSAPPRNCDVGTPEEQVQRMTDAFCMKQWKDGLIRCSLCPISCTNGRRTCTLTWAQMHYAAEEGGAAQ